MSTSGENLRVKFRDARRWMQAAAIKNLRNPMVLQRGEAGVLRVISQLVGSVFGSTDVRKAYSRECRNEIASLLPLRDSDRGVIFTLVGDNYDLDHRSPSMPELDRAMIKEVIAKSGIIESVRAGRAPSLTRVKYLVSGLSRVVEDSYTDALDRTVKQQTTDKTTKWLIIDSSRKPVLRKPTPTDGLKKLRVLEPSACEWCRTKPSIMSPEARVPRHKGCLCTTRLVRR